MRSASTWLLCETRIIKYCVSLYPARRKVLVDLVLEKAGRRSPRHELAVHLGGDAAVLDELAVAELDLQQLRLRVVAYRADLARGDAFSFHGDSSDTVMLSPERTEASCRGSPSIMPRTLQRVTRRDSSPSDTGVRPQGRASALPSVQKQTVPGGTTCLAAPSSVAFTGSSKYTSSPQVWALAVTGSAAARARAVGVSSRVALTAPLGQEILMRA